MKKVVFTFGRMNPPTIGHEKLVNKLKAIASKYKMDVVITSEDVDKNMNSARSRCLCNSKNENNLQYDTFASKIQHNHLICMFWHFT